MNKRIVVSASCIYEFSSDTSEAFTVVVTDQLADRIRELAATARRLNTYKISEFNFEGTFGGHDLAGSGIDLADAEAVADQIVQQADVMDMILLNVTANDFYFSGIPEDRGEEMTLNAKRIPLIELDNPNPLIDLS